MDSEGWPDRPAGGRCNKKHSIFNGSGRFSIKMVLREKIALNPRKIMNHIANVKLERPMDELVRGMGAQ